MKKNEKRFVAISLIIILALIGIYSYRLVYYYKQEHPKDDSNVYPKLHEKILTAQDKSNGLNKDSKTNSYYFYGDADNNYVLFSGKLFRIVNLDEDGNLKLITDKSQTVLTYGGDYKISYVHDWLNPNCDECGNFYKNIDDTYLTYTRVYIDKVDDVNDINSKNTYDDSVGLLSLYEYMSAGGSSSYLNNGEDWWLSTTTSNGETWFVAKNQLDKAQSYSHISKGVRPVITLSYKASVIKGNGTKTNPYIIEERTVKTVDDLYVGETIKIQDLTYKIVSKNTDSVKIKLDGYIDLERNFDYEQNVYDVEDKNSLAYYLNNNVLMNKEYLVECDWYNGSYGITDYNYKNAYSSSVKSSAGLLSIGDFYIDETPTFLLNTKESLTSIYTISEDKTIYENEIITTSKISPSYCIKNDLEISGTDSYVLGGEYDEA